LPLLAKHGNVAFAFATYANAGYTQLVARRNKAFTTNHMARHNKKAGRSKCRVLYKTSAIIAGGFFFVITHFGDFKKLKRSPQTTDDETP
jgi:hypothetical protein